MPDWTITELPVLGEKLHQCTVPPGLQVFVLPRPGYRKKYAVLATHFGSIDSRYRVDGKSEIRELPEGLAHFLEHKLFEDERGNVFDRFAESGASANAYTTFTHTAYLFSATERFDENLELLLDFVQEPYFTAQSVQNEQGIIGQEIRMYDDNAQWRLFSNLLKALFREHPVRNNIEGTVESIARITPEVLYRCYRTYYHPSNMALFAVGDVDPQRVGEMAAANLGRRGYELMGEIRRFYPAEPPEIHSPRISQELAVSEPLVNVGFKDPAAAGMEGASLLRREIVMELLLGIIFGRSEPLFNTLYQEGLIDDRFDAGYVAEGSYGYTLIGGETEQPEELYRRILAGIREFRQKGITPEQFERHRRCQLGAYLRQFNSLEFIANNFLAYHFRGGDFFSFPAVLSGIEQAEAEALLAENLAEERHAVSMILPKSEIRDGS